MALYRVVREVADLRPCGSEFAYRQALSKSLTLPKGVLRPGEPDSLLTCAAGRPNKHPVTSLLDSTALITEEFEVRQTPGLLQAGGDAR